MSMIFAVRMKRLPLAMDEKTGRDMRHIDATATTKPQRMPSCQKLSPIHSMSTFSAHDRTKYASQSYYNLWQSCQETKCSL